MNKDDPLTKEAELAFANLEASRYPGDGDIEAWACAMNEIEIARRVARDTLARTLDRIKKNHESIMRELDRKEKNTIWWGIRAGVPDMVRAKIKGGKLKSVKTHYGPVGFRIKPKKFVRPLRNGCTMEQVEEWAKKNCKDAVTSKTKTTVNINKIPANAEQELFWVEDIPPTEEFGWKPLPPQKQEKTNE